MLVTVDVIELITLLVLGAFGALGGGAGILYVLMPGSARNIFKGKWLKFGKRNYNLELNEDNVLDAKVGRPRDWGIKVGKKRYLVPRGQSDLVDRRAILAGTGIPCYISSTRTGMASSPDFLQLSEEIINGEVEITPRDKEFKVQKPQRCPITNREGKLACETGALEDVFLRAGKDKELKHWKCKECEATFEPVRFLNAHIMNQISEDIFDQSLVQAIEREAYEEARTEKPTWFVWLMIGLIPYFVLTLFNVMLMSGTA